MWSTLAFTAALSLAPAQAGDLELVNSRITYGTLGPKRESNQFLPGDVFYVSYDIKNITVQEDGKALYSMGMELTNKEGKVQFKREPQELEAYASLGGSQLPAFAFTQIGRDTPPGEYSMAVTVLDRVSKKKATLNSKFEVTPSAFGIVQFGTSFDVETRVAAPPLAVVGQNLWISFALVGFELDTKKQPNLSAALTILDDSGNATTKKPILGEATEVTEEFKKIVPMQFRVNLNRAGTYKLKLTASDNLGKKKTEQVFDFTVRDLAAK